MVILLPSAAIKTDKGVLVVTQRETVPALVRKYCEIEIAEGGDPAKVTPLNRRSQILFLTEDAKADGKQNPKLETLLKLTDAVGAEIQLVFTRKEVRRF